MVLSFSEKRAQTRALRNISFWLQPQSRTFETSRDVTIEDLELLCGPIRGTQFDADLFNDIFKNTFDMAEGFLVEYAATLGYKLTEFKMPSSYSMVSRLPNKDPGKELNLTLSVLQTIVNGNELASTLPDIAERLEKLKETKSNLEKDESEFPKIFSSFEDRIKYCDGVSKEEIDMFIEQMDKDESYQEKLSVFVDRHYLLKGVKHAQVIQRAYQKIATMNKPFYDSLLSAMQSIVNRLSIEDMEELFDGSGDHFKAVSGLKREYVTEFKDTVDRDKDGVFTARVLLRGPTTASEELAKFLHADNSNQKTCIKILRRIPPPLHKILFETHQPPLLSTLFSMSKPFAASNFDVPMNCLVLSGIFPLHKLLAKMTFNAHLQKIFSSGPIRKYIKEMDMISPVWEETAQSIISCLSIVSTPMGMTVEAIRSVLDLVKTKSGDESELIHWLSKYQNYKGVAQWIGLIPTPEVSTKESSSVETVVNVEKKEEEEKEEKGEEVKKNEEETVNVEEDGKTKEQETKSEKKEEEVKESKEETVKVDVNVMKKGETPKRETQAEKRKRKKKEQQEKKRSMEAEQIQKEVNAETVKEKENGKVPEVLADDTKVKEKDVKAEAKKESPVPLIDLTGDSDTPKIELIDLTVDSDNEKEEKVTADQVSRDLADKNATKEEKANSEQVAHLESLVSSIALARSEDTNGEEEEDSDQVSDVVLDTQMSGTGSDESETDLSFIDEDVGVIAVEEDDEEEQYESEEDEEDEERKGGRRLAATQSSDGSSQGGFSRSINGSTLNIDEI